MSRVEQILIDRGYSEEEARSMVDECANAMLRRPWQADEIIEDYLGLEPDYIEDILFCF